MVLDPLLPQTLSITKAFDAEELELTSKMERKPVTLRMKDQSPMG